MKPPVMIAIQTPGAMADSLHEFAQKQGMAIDSCANLLLLISVRKFNRDTRTKSPTRLLDTYAQEFRAFEAQNPHAIEIGITIDRQLVNKLRLLAGEYERETEEVITSFLKHAMGAACMVGTV